VASLTILAVANPAAPYLGPLRELPSNFRVLAGNQAQFIERWAPEADVLVVAGGQHDAFQTAFRLAKNVKWVHSLWAGVEGLLIPELVESAVPFTNGRGVFSGGLAEFVVAAMLFFSKDLRRMLRNQAQGRWEPFEVEELNQAVLGIIGYGETGRACGKLARALGMRIVATRRRPELSAADPYVDTFYTADHLLDLIRMSDYLLITAPLTAATRGLIAEGELRAMKKNAVLINVGRGPIVVESALIAALTENRIRGAALDVFKQEPLPAGHPLYALDNVLLSPHCADLTLNSGSRLNAARFFVENLDRFVKGEPLRNVVDKVAGY
jgi:phosphoglycerate dehydrogenase-like enzyme